MKISLLRSLCLSSSLTICLFAGLWSGFLGGCANQDKNQEIIRPVRIVRPEYSPLAKELLLTGYVEAEQSVTVLPRVSGVLEELNIVIGQTVSEGESLAVIDSDPYRISLNQAQSAFSTAESTYNRVKTLRGSGATTEENFNQAQGSLNAYKSQYNLAQLNLAYTNIRSPLNGVVLAVHSNKGALVSPEVPLFTLGDLSRLRVTLLAPEKYYINFVKKQLPQKQNQPTDIPQEKKKPGNFEKTNSSMSASIRIPALANRSYPAHLRVVAPYINAANRSFEIIVDFNDPDDDPRPGMFVYVTLILEESPPLWSLPWSALTGENQLWYIDNENRAQMITIDPGYSTKERFSIDEKYKDYSFIEEGQHFLKEGNLLRVTP